MAFIGELLDSKDPYDRLIGRILESWRKLFNKVLGMRASLEASPRRRRAFMEGMAIKNALLEKLLTRQELGLPFPFKKS
jgi:hypothetical protein